MICGAEAWANDTTQRETLAVVVKLPQSLPEVAFSYLSLFRPAKSSLSWSKAKRVAGELAKLVATGHIQVDSRPVRPCPASVWKKAIEEMLDRRDRLSRPLKNHNYLRQVAYDLADQADAHNEKTREAQHRTASRISQDHGQLDLATYQALSAKEKQFLPANVRARFEEGE
jgi:hypothetical protein